MTPSSCRTAPSLISFQAKRSFTPVMAARLRIRLVANGSSFNCLPPPHAPRGEVSASDADGGVMSSGTGASDPSARCAGTSPSRLPRRGGSRFLGHRLLLGEGAVDFVSQEFGELD